MIESNATDTARVDTSLLGWNAPTRQWVLGDGAAVDRVPELKSSWLDVSESGLAAASRDLGNLVHARPGAVLRARSVTDIASMVKFCGRHEIPVAARGTAHTTHGQGLVDGGLIIDMTTLSTICDVNPDSPEVEVHAGVLWSNLLAATAVHGLRPVTLTGYLQLTVGGTLSVGGISSAWREGAQIDHVLALQVVTGAGDIEWCSREYLPDLFFGALGGLGQVGIITRAVLDLAPMPPLVRIRRLPYVDVGDAITALRELMDRDEVDELYCKILPPAHSTPPLYMVIASSYHRPSDPPDDGSLLRGLPRSVSEPIYEDTDYVSHVSAVDQLIDPWRADGWDDRPKPWFDVFLPDGAVEYFVGDVVPTLGEEDWSLPDNNGFVLLFPHRASAFTCPRLRVPTDTAVVWLFDILNVGRTGRDQDYVDRMLRRNKQLWNQARALGGVRYPIGSLDYDLPEWRAHYGEVCDDVIRIRHRYDPAGILTPGLGFHATTADEQQLPIDVAGEWRIPRRDRHTPGA